MNISTFYFLIIFKYVLSKDLIKQYDHYSQIPQYSYFTDNNQMLLNNKNKYIKDENNMHTVVRTDKLNSQDQSIIKEKTNWSDNFNTFEINQFEELEPQQTLTIQQDKQQQQEDYQNNYLCQNLSQQQQDWIIKWYVEFQMLNDVLDKNYEDTIINCNLLINQHGKTEEVKQQCRDYYQEKLAYQYRSEKLNTLESIYQQFNELQQLQNSEILQNCYQQLLKQISTQRQQQEQKIDSQFTKYLEENNNQSNNTIITLKQQSQRLGQVSQQEQTKKKPQTLTQAVEQGIIKQSVDWVAEKKVSPVKYTGLCLSSWAFAITSMLESASLLQKNEPVELSNQLLVDCTLFLNKIKDEKASTCNQSARLTNIIQFVKNYGIAYEKEYSYTKKPGICKKDMELPFKIKEFHSLKSADILEFLKVLQKRPVTLALHINYRLSIDKYQIVRHDDTKICKQDEIPNTAVLAVGYHIDPINEDQIWVNLKFPFGTSFSNNGYIKLQIRNKIPDQDSPERFGSCNMLQFYDSIIWADLA